MRRDQAGALEGLTAARKSGDIEEGSLGMGQDSGLIRDIPPAGDVVKRIAEEAEEILRRSCRGASAQLALHGRAGPDAQVREVPQRDIDQDTPLREDAGQRAAVEGEG